MYLQSLVKCKIRKYTFICQFEGVALKPFFFFFIIDLLFLVLKLNVACLNVPIKCTIIATFGFFN